MKLVLDSCVGIKTAVPEKGSEQADALIAASHELIAPDIYPLEAAHVLSKLVRQSKLPESDARKALELILDTRPALESSIQLLPVAVDISFQMRCSLWDALYVALAEREGCRMVTADLKLVNNMKKTYPFVIDLASIT